MEAAKVVTRNRVATMSNFLIQSHCANSNMSVNFIYFNKNGDILQGLTDFNILSHSRKKKIFTIKGCTEISMSFTTLVWWLKLLSLSFSWRKSPLHFWSVFSPGPEAEKRRLETSAGPCPSPHPEREKQDVCFVATLTQSCAKKPRLQPCSCSTSAKGGAVTLFMSLNVCVAKSITA